MKLIFTSSPAYDPLRDRVLLNHLYDPWEIIDLRYPDRESLFRHRHIRFAEMVHCHADEILVFTDVDLQFLRPAQPLLLQAFEGSEVLFQRELPERNVHTGFMAVRCTPGAMRFMDKFANGITPGQRAHSFINDMIAKNRFPCSFNVLPTTFFSDGLNNPHAPPLDWLVTYHSTPTQAPAGSDPLQMKLDKHRLMKNNITSSLSSLPSLVENAPPRVIAGDKPYQPPARH